LRTALRSSVAPLLLPLQTVLVILVDLHRQSIVCVLVLVQPRASFGPETVGVPSDIVSLSHGRLVELAIVKLAASAIHIHQALPNDLVLHQKARVCGESEERGWIRAFFDAFVRQPSVEHRQMRIAEERDGLPRRHLLGEYEEAVIGELGRLGIEERL